MNNQEKQNIKERLSDYIKSRGSQNKAANSLNVSSATISQVMNNNWELINDSMWRKIAAQIGLNNDGWQFAETANYQKLNFFFSDAKEHSLVMSIVGAAGAGKSGTIEKYAGDTSNVYHLQCNEYWDRRWFLKELMKKMGYDPAGMQMPQMMEEVVEQLQKQDKPQIILDEADKLRDQVLYFFITLYNRLEDQCSIIMMATPFLKKRIERGISLNRKGYNEIYSRLGKRFIDLHTLSLEDVILICGANGVEDKAAIKKIYNDCDGDIRRVKRLVHAHKRNEVNG
jgi:plasmid maintenance system antidote protein VapI